MMRVERLLIAAIVLVLVFMAAWGLGRHAGAAAVQADWDREKLASANAQKLAIAAAVARNDAAHVKDLADTRAALATQKRMTDEANERITAERTAADRDRLRITIPRTNCPAPAGPAASPIIADGAGTEQVELPSEIERGLRDLAEDADREIARLQAKIAALQQWLISHGFADAEP